MIHVETNFGAASVAVAASGQDVLITLALGSWPAQRITINAQNAAELAKRLRAAAAQATDTAARVAGSVS